jgi:hypothetical protein
VLVSNAFLSESNDSGVRKCPTGASAAVCGVIIVLQWCYNGVTMVLQWCYSGVTVVSQL